MAREGSKRQAAILIMTAMKDKPMDETCARLQKEIGLTVPHSRGYYRYIVQQGWAPGVIENTRSAAKAAAPKAEKAPKVKAEKPKASPPSPEAMKANAERLKKATEAKKVPSFVKAEKEPAPAPAPEVKAA